MRSTATQPGRLWDEGQGWRDGWEKETEREKRQERRNMKALSSNFFSLRLPQLLFSLPLSITFHCHSSLRSPLTTCAALLLSWPALRSLACSHSSSFPLFLHPHKWLSETGQVLQNSPCSSTCLIQGLIAPRQVIRCLLTERGTHAQRKGLPPTHNEYKHKMPGIFIYIYIYIISCKEIHITMEPKCGSMAFIHFIFQSKLSKFKTLTDLIYSRNSWRPTYWHSSRVGAETGKQALRNTHSHNHFLQYLSHLSTLMNSNWGTEIPEALE